MPFFDEVDFTILCCYSIVFRLPGVVLLPPLPTCDLHAAIQDSFAVINSSTSEGMASAVLEVSVLSEDGFGNYFCLSSFRKCIVTTYSHSL